MLDRVEATFHAGTLTLIRACASRSRTEAVAEIGTISNDVKIVPTRARYSVVVSVT